MKKNIIFTLVIWLVIFAILEAGTRAYNYFREASSARPEFTTDPTAIFIPHPFTTYAANPSNINHNAQGYRAEKGTLYKADSSSINIACLGGSSTYGTRVYNKDSYPYLLEEQLSRSTDKTVNVINAGLGGYSTPNIISLLSGKIIHLKPALTLFYVGFNDAWTRLMFSDFKTDYSHAQKSWEIPAFPFWRHSRFFDLAASQLGYPSEKLHIHSVAWHQMSGKPETNLRNSSGEAFRTNLMTLISISRTHGSVPVLITQATDFKNHPLPANNKAWIRAMEEHTAILKQVAASMSVDLIDVRSPMTDKKEYFLDVLHMNGKGNRKRADIIADYLVRNKLLGKNVKETEAATLDVISEYMKLQRADIFIKRVLKYRIGQLRNAGTKITAEDEAKIIDTFSNFENVIALYAPMYKHLSKETLIKANTFFSSEPGRKSISSYVRGGASQKINLSEDGLKRIKAYQDSAGWKEIQKQRSYINRDAQRISDNIIRQLLRGELKPVTSDK